MKYKLTPDIAEFTKNQLAKNAGWALVYHANEDTGEYTGASYEYILKNVGLPAHSYIDAPTLPEKGYAIARSFNDKCWEHVTDHRGKTVFDIHTGKQHTIENMGELPGNFTLIAPQTEFDIWDGEKWIADDEARTQAKKQTAERELQSKLHEANERIQILNDALELDIATEEEIATLAKWKAYRVEINRINMTQPTEIVWPQQPAQLDKSA